MRNRNILLTGTMLLLAAATAAGAPQGGGQGSEPVLTAERIAADSAIRARRTLRVYQTLELPYARTLNKTAATGNSTTYYEHDIDKYPTNDFRNSLTGVVAGLTVRELTGTPGMFYASETGRTAIYARGMTPEYIVDGMPIYITQLQLDPEEIESMTFIRDIADKALLGSRAADGVLYITTRRGRLTDGRSAWASKAA